MTTLPWVVVARHATGAPFVHCHCHHEDDARVRARYFEMDYPGAVAEAALETEARAAKVRLREQQDALRSRRDARPQQCEAECSTTRRRCWLSSSYERDCRGYRIHVCGVHQSAYDPRPWLGVLTSTTGSLEPSARQAR